MYSGSDNDAPSVVELAKEHYSDLEPTKRQTLRCKISEESLTSIGDAKKWNSETWEFYVPTSADAEPRKRKRSKLLREQEGPDPQFTQTVEMNKRSGFSSIVSAVTPTPVDTARRRRKCLYGEFDRGPTREIRRSRHDSGIFTRDDDDGYKRVKFKGFGDCGLEQDAPHVCDGTEKEISTQGSELHVCTPISEILEFQEDGRQCGAHTARARALTGKPSRSQKKLFCGPSDKGRHAQQQRDGAVGDGTRRGWAVDKRRKDLDHGKFTEDELISLNCGLNELIKARKWNRDEAVRILTHSSGRGMPHAEARGVWKEIAKSLPSSSIVRVNMKARSLLFKGKSGRWDAEETQLLKRLVEEHDNDWISISSKLGRSNGACARKWKTMWLDECRTRKRGKWTQDEYDGLCLYVREAKATRILTPSRKAGNRKVKDNLRWEPIAFKMGRPPNQCSAVWYERLAPSLDKERWLSEEDRQWADEDDRRLLKKMQRLISRHGEIAWPEVFLRNRKQATCKARFNQMTRCLGQQSEAAVEQQLKLLVRRYAPNLIVKPGVKWVQCRNEMEDEGDVGVGGNLQLPDRERYMEETHESKSKEGNCTIDTVQSSYTFTNEAARGGMRRSPEFDWEHGEHRGRRRQFRTAKLSESSCLMDEESVDLLRYEEGGQSREGKAGRSQTSLEVQQKIESSLYEEDWTTYPPTFLRQMEDEGITYPSTYTREMEEDEITYPPTYLRRMEEGNTSEWHADVVGGNHYRNDFLCTKRSKVKIPKGNSEEYRHNFGNSEDSLECQSFYKDWKGQVDFRTSKRESIRSKSKLGDEGWGKMCQLVDENEDSGNEDDGSMSLEF